MGGNEILNQLHTTFGRNSAVDSQNCLQSGVETFNPGICVGIVWSLNLSNVQSHGAWRLMDK